MKNKNALRGVLVAFIALLLATCVLPPLPRSKARPSHVTAVNNISSFSMTITNALPTAAPGK